MGNPTGTPPNNGKVCPYEEHGCMFKHEHAPTCSRKGLCRSNLCQFQPQHELEKVDAEVAVGTEGSEDNLENEDDDEVEMNKIINKPTKVRCNYGLCDFL